MAPCSRRVRRQRNGSWTRDPPGWPDLPDDIKVVVFGWFVIDAGDHDDKLEAAKTLYVLNRTFGERWRPVVLLHSKRIYFSLYGAIQCLIATQANWASEVNNELANENSQVRQDVFVETESKYHLPFSPFTGFDTSGSRPSPSFLSPRYIAMKLVYYFRIRSDESCYCYYHTLVRAYADVVRKCGLITSNQVQADGTIPRLEGFVVKVVWHLNNLSTNIMEWEELKNTMWQNPNHTFAGWARKLRLKDIVQIETDLRRFLVHNEKNVAIQRVRN